MGEAAKKVVEENRGATDITSKICAKAIKEMVST
jgi:hypothetical protein